MSNKNWVRNFIGKKATQTSKSSKVEEMEKLEPSIPSTWKESFNNLKNDLEVKYTIDQIATLAGLTGGSILNQNNVNWNWNQTVKPDWSYTPNQVNYPNWIPQPLKYNQTVKYDQATLEKIQKIFTESMASTLPRFFLPSSDGVHFPCQ